MWTFFFFFFNQLENAYLYVVVVSCFFFSMCKASGLNVSKLLNPVSSLVECSDKGLIDLKLLKLKHCIGLCLWNVRVLLCLFFFNILKCIYIYIYT